MAVALEIADLLERVKQNGHEVWIAGPQCEADIAAVEATLQVCLPPSYRQFLLQYGGMAISNSYIAGIIEDDPLSINGGSLYGETVRLREEQELPNYLIVVEPDDEAPYCFDTRYPDTEGEFPLNCYELYSGADGKVADNFPQFMVDWFLKGWLEE